MMNVDIITMISIGVFSCNILVELAKTTILKKLDPQITAIVIALLYVVGYGVFNSIVITAQTIVAGIGITFIIAYISMYGYDKIKDYNISLAE